MTNKYVGLITNYHTQSPKYTEHVNLFTRPLFDISKMLLGLVDDFDLDLAVGRQLDIVGEWVGLSRVVKQAISDVYFTFDDENLGFGRGVWQGPYDSDEGYAELSDETYRLAIKTKVALNNWNGQVDTLVDILDAATAGSGIRLQVIDNQNMTISVRVIPDTNINDVSQELLAIIKQGYLTIKPAGVSTSVIDYIDNASGVVNGVIYNGSSGI